MPQTFRPTADSCSIALSGFAEATSTALVTTNADGLITFWNPAAERMFGYAAVEALGRSLDIIVPPQFREEHHAGLRRMAAGQPARLAGKPVEVIAARRDGSEFPVEITLAS